MQCGAKEVWEAAGAPARAAEPSVACLRRKLVSSRQLLSPVGVQQVDADPFPRGTDWKTVSWGATREDLQFAGGVSVLLLIFVSRPQNLLAVGHPVSTLCRRASRAS